MKRRDLCTKIAWCVRVAGHRGNCVEKPREPYALPDWDRRTRHPIGWAERKRSRGEK